MIWQQWIDHSAKCAHPIWDGFMKHGGSWGSGCCHRHHHPPTPPPGECWDPLPACRKASPVGGTDGGKGHEQRNHPRGRVENAVAERLQRKQRSPEVSHSPQEPWVPRKLLGSPQGAQAPTPGWALAVNPSGRGECREPLRKKTTYSSPPPPPEL